MPNSLSSLIAVAIARSRRRGVSHVGFHSPLIFASHLSYASNAVNFRPPTPSDTRRCPLHPRRHHRQTVHTWMFSRLARAFRLIRSSKYSDAVIWKSLASTRAFRSGASCGAGLENLLRTEGGKPQHYGWRSRRSLADAVRR
jgi:hypothetical protein